MGMPVTSVEVAFTTDPGEDFPDWTDLSDRLISCNVNRGRSNELDRFMAGRATIVLANEDRALDPTLGAGTQHIDFPGTTGNYASTPDSDAVSLRGTESALRLTGHIGTYASAPDSPALSLQGTEQVLAMGPTGATTWVQTPSSAAYAITDDFELRWEGYLDDYDAGIGSDQRWLVHNYSHNVAGFKLINNASATLQAQFAISGSSLSVTASHSLTPAVRIRLRVTRIWSSGLTTVYGGDAATDWEALPSLASGTVFAAQDIPASANTLRLGGGEGTQPDTRARHAGARITIGSVVVANPDFTEDGDGWAVGDQAGTAKTDSAGKTWTLQSQAEIVALAERRSLRLNGTTAAGTPDSAGLSITGDIDIRVKVALDDWTPATNRNTLVGKWLTAGNQESFIFSVAVGGNLELLWTTDGSTNIQKTSTAATGVPDGAAKWVRVTLDVDNGAAGNDVKFYTSDDGVTWVQLGTTVTTAGVTSIFDSTTGLHVGGYGSTGTQEPMIGNVFYAEVRNAIGTSGTVVAAPDFTRRPWDVGDTNGATGADSTGRTWTLNGTGAVIQRAFASDVDIRMKVSMHDWTPASPNRKLVGKNYMLFVLTGGALSFGWSYGGPNIFKNSTATTGFVDGSVNWVRVTFDVDNGAGGNDVKFYTSNDGVNWSQLGSTVTTAGTAVIFDSTEELRIGQPGTDTLAGAVHKAEIRNGIDGVIVASPDFTGSPWAFGDQSSTARTDDQGNTWTLQGNAEIVSPKERRSLRLSGAAGTYASAPDSVAVSITGDIDIRVKVALDDWTPAVFMGLIAKRDVDFSDSAWRFAVNTSGTLTFAWWQAASPLESVSTVATGLADGTAKWVRVTLDVDNGAAGNDTKFYTSDDGTTWTQLGATVTKAGTTSIDDTVGLLTVGTSGTDELIGNVFYAEVRNGIDGTIVANPDFTARPWDVGDTNTATGADTVGNTWTLNGTGAVIQRAYASDLDIRVKVAMDDWSPAARQTFAMKYAAGGDQRSWRFLMNTTPRLEFAVSGSGTSAGLKTATASAATGFSDGTAHWVRVTWRVSDGRVQFFTSEDGDDWVQLGTNQTVGAWGVYDSTAILEVPGGTNEPLAGQVYYASIADEINGDPIAVFDPNRIDYTPPRTPATWVAPTGEIWTVNGLAWAWGGTWGSPYYPNVIPMRRIRIRAEWDGDTYDIFTGFVDSWEQQYMPPEGAVCVVSATDGFKVLANAELVSSAYAEDIYTDGPILWWRLGDPAGTTTAIESVAAARPLTALGAPTFGAEGLGIHDPDGAVQFATGSDGLQGAFSGGFPLSTAGSVELIYRDDDTSDFSGAPRFGIASLGAVPTGMETLEHLTSLVVNLYNTAGGVFSASTTGVDLGDGAVHHVVVTWVAGSTIKLYVDGVDRTAGGAGTFTGTMANTTDPWIVILNRADFPPYVTTGFPGTYDELSVWDRALTSGEVADHYEAFSEAWSGEATGERVMRILDAAGWSANDRDVELGMTDNLQPAVLGGTALAYLQKVEETEQGALFINAAGQVRFIGRDSLLMAPYNTSQGTFGDSGSELEYADLVYVYDDQLIINDVQVTREGGVTQVVGDQASQTRYLRRTKVFDGMMYSTDNESRDLANWTLSHYKDVLLRATNVILEPSAGNEITHFPHVLGRELLDRVTVRRRPQNIGAAIDQAVLIEGITHDVTATEWRTTWNLSPAETQTYWLLGVAGFSELGQTTRLAM